MTKREKPWERGWALQLRKPSSQISNFNLRTGILITGCMACGGGRYMTIHNADNDMRSGNKVEKAIKCKCGHSYRGGAKTGMYKRTAKLEYSLLAQLHGLAYMPEKFLKTSHTLTRIH
jgi:hypothetical protein